MINSDNAVINNTPGLKVVGENELRNNANHIPDLNNLPPGRSTT